MSPCACVIPRPDAVLDVVPRTLARASRSDGLKHLARHHNDADTGGRCGSDEQRPACGQVQPMHDGRDLCPSPRRGSTGHPCTPTLLGEARIIVTRTGRRHCCGDSSGAAWHQNHGGLVSMATLSSAVTLGPHGRCPSLHRPAPRSRASHQRPTARPRGHRRSWDRHSRPVPVLWPTDRSVHLRAPGEGHP